MTSFIGAVSLGLAALVFPCGSLRPIHPISENVAIACEEPITRHIVVAYEDGSGLGFQHGVRWIFLEVLNVSTIEVMLCCECLQSSKMTCFYEKVYDMEDKTIYRYVLWVLFILVFGLGAIDRVADYIARSRGIPSYRLIAAIYIAVQTARACFGTPMPEIPVGRYG